MSERQLLEDSTALVAGKYRLTRVLGRGGMGAVWEGMHATLGTRVAVKFIDPEYADSPEARSRFENEARAAAALRSKHVVEMYDHGLAEDGSPFIVMEYLDGEPLDRKLDRLGRLPPAETARILHQACRAVARAHAAGIVHRDLKPENLFLVWDDEDQTDFVKVLDFGIAKFTDRSISASSATRTGSVLGTPFYMSPEQARGLRSVDHRTDVWSLGVIAYRCIVGNLPFDGEAIGDLLVRLCTEPIPVPSQMTSDVPPGFDGFIERALCRDLTKRFQTVQELADALARSCGVPARSVLASQDLSQPTPELPRVIAAPPRADSRSNAAVTEGALTQSADPTQVPRGGRAPRFAVAAALVVVLAVGAGVAVRALPNFGAAPAAEAGAVMAAKPESPPEQAAPAREPVTPTPQVEPKAPPAPEPAPVASVRPASSSVPVLPRPAPAAARRPVRAPIAREAPPADPGLKQGKRQIDLGY